MKTLPKRTIIRGALVLFCASYLLWSHAGRVDATSTLTNGSSPPLSVIEIGKKSTRGNLIGIQPFMQTADYANEQSFYNKLDSYLKQASMQGFLTPKSLVVFPEHIGTWLVAAHEKRFVYQTKNSNAALQLVAFSNIFSFAGAYSKARAQDKVKAALFLMKAKDTARIYASVFKRLASRYQTTIVAGSVFLPDPLVEGNEILSKGNEIYNAAFLFSSDGKISPQVTRKKFPIREEQIFCKADAKALPKPYPTPLGRLQIVVCADSWYPSIYQHIAANQAEIMVIPSFSSPDNLWQSKWKGYNGAPAPSDVDDRDIGKITEEEAWIKYSMAGRAKSTSIKLGINVFLRGTIWDLGDDGRTIVYKNGKIYTAPFYDGPQLTIVWK